MDNGGPHCVAFGGLRVDDAIEEELLGVVVPGPSPPQPAAAARKLGNRRDQARDALSRDLEAARYAVDRAFGSMTPLHDPANQLVASEPAGTGGARPCGGNREQTGRAQC